MSYRHINSAFDRENVEALKAVKQFSNRALTQAVLLKTLLKESENMWEKGGFSTVRRVGEGSATKNRAFAHNWPTDH